MIFKRITSRTDSMYDKAIELYKLSFPPHEQRQERSQNEILNDGEYHFELIYDGALFVGIILYWERASFVYVEHFCIFPELRGRRYGQRALSLLSEKGKTVILEIDPPEDEISVRRRAFYERCGFAENPYTHIHPPYHKENSGHSLVVMSSPNIISEKQYDEFNEYLKNRVMHGAF